MLVSQCDEGGVGRDDGGVQQDDGRVDEGVLRPEAVQDVDQALGRQLAYLGRLDEVARLGGRGRGVMVRCAWGAGPVFYGGDEEWEVQADSCVVVQRAVQRQYTAP